MPEDRVLPGRGGPELRGPFRDLAFQGRVERADLLLRGELGADVPDDGGDADGLPARGTDRRDRDEDGYGIAVAMEPQRGQRGDRLPETHAIQGFALLRPQVRRHDEVTCVASDGLGGREAEEALGRRVPVRDGPVERLADDGVLRVLDDGRQAAPLDPGENLAPTSGQPEMGDAGEHQHGDQDGAAGGGR